MRRILGKCREVRGVLAATGEDVSVVVHELLDEIEEQAPSFRLMMANIQVMINLETPDAPVNCYPVEPPAVVSRIVERYTGQAVEQGKDIAWWSEPEDFGLVYSDAAALEHIIANLVDNALRYGGDYIEITVTRDSSMFQVKVTDDGPGIPGPVSPSSVRAGLDAGDGAQPEKKLPPAWGCTSAEPWRNAMAATCR